MAGGGQSAGSLGRRSGWSDQQHLLLIRWPMRRKLKRADVFSLRFSRLSILAEFITYFLAVPEKGSPLQGRYVNEHIGSAVFRRNEAESFVSVEKLYSASGHVSPVASAGISCDAHPKVLNRQPQPFRASARGRGEANSGRRTCDRREPKSVL